MFGGLAFLICGRMAISASGQGGVLVHVDPGRSGDLVATTRAATAVMQGREMPGRLRVNPEDLASDDDLSRWVKSASDMRGLLRAAGRCVSLAASAESVSVHVLRWEYRADVGTARPRDGQGPRRIQRRCRGLESAMVAGGPHQCERLLRGHAPRPRIARQGDQAPPHRARATRQIPAP